MVNALWRGSANIHIIFLQYPLEDVMCLSRSMLLSLSNASSQMYVPGTLNDVEHVLVDVGTGYYVEKVTF